MQSKEKSAYPLFFNNYIYFKSLHWDRAVAGKYVACKLFPILRISPVLPHQPQPSHHYVTAESKLEHEE